MATEEDNITLAQYALYTTDQAVETGTSWPFFGSFQLIYRLTQADISCTTTAGLFFSPLLATDRDWLTCESGPCLSEWRPSYGIDRGRRCTLEVRGHDPSEEVL